MLFNLKNWLFIFVAVMMPAIALADPAQVFINEIYIDPPGGDDEEFEYVEWVTDAALPSTTSACGQYRYYFVALENEGSNNEGEVDMAFQLVSSGDGTDWAAHDDEVWSDAGGCNRGTPDVFYAADLENSGATYMIIAVPHGVADVPMAGDDYDDDDSGELGDGDWNANWMILDSVGVVGESDDVAGAVLYGRVNFIPGDPTNATTLSGSTNIRTDQDGPSSCPAGFDEIEYVGRCPDSGSIDCNGTWFAANLTDGCAGFSNCEFAIGGDANNDPECIDENGDPPHNWCEVITDTQGATNESCDFVCP